MSSGTKTAQPSAAAAQSNSAGIALSLRIGFWICVVIAIAAALRRIVALLHPSQSAPPQQLALDALFASHAALTLAHIVPAMAFVILSPFVLLRRKQNSWPERWMYPLGIVTGLTAFAMAAYPVGGWVERSAVLCFNSIFLFSLIRAWRYSFAGDFDSKARWLLRAIVVLLGIATTRPVMGIFFATSSVTHMAPSQFFGIAFWIGFSINWIVVELWIRAKHV